MHLALGTGSPPPGQCDHPVASLPEADVADGKSKRGARSRKNPRGGMLILTCGYTK